MGNKVLILDTSVLCCWLQVTGKDTCGSGADAWDRIRIDTLINKEIREGAILVLPLARIL